MCVCGRGGYLFAEPSHSIYNTTLLPSVSTLARGMLCGAKYTHHTGFTFNIPSNKTRFSETVFIIFIVIPEFWFQHTAEWCSRPCLSLTGQRDRLGMENKKDRKKHGHHFSEGCSCRLA